MRKALIIGIDSYKNSSDLNGCVNDAYSVKSVLGRHSNGTVNFGVKTLVATNTKNQITRRELKNHIIELFRDDCEIALFYFAGHGYIDDLGGYLITSDASEYDEGIPMNDILKIANDSPAKNRIIVLDTCHSGIFGTPDQDDNKATLKEGITILTASSAEQYAMEENGSGTFTNLFVDALTGSSANLVGDITPGSIYAHIDQSLGPWQQRPIFKTNVKRFVTLRQVEPPISLEDLKKITELFPEKGYEFKLDPSYEPDSEAPVEENTKKFAILQQYNRINLLVPVNENHMYFAAMNSKSCKLTLLGEHYWNLIANEMI